MFGTQANQQSKVHTNLSEANIYPIQMGLPEKIWSI